MSTPLPLHQTRLGLPFETHSDDIPPDNVLAYISVAGEASVFTEEQQSLDKPLEAYHAPSDRRDTVRRDLESSGFQILAESRLGFSVSAPPEAYEELTGGTVVAKERLMYAEENCVRYVTHLDIVGDEQPASLGVAKTSSDSIPIDGVVLERPRMFNAVFPSPVPPSTPKFHLRVPDDVATLLNAKPAHQAGHRGANVLVAMPDSGQFRHPFFTAHNYRVRTPITVVPGTNRSKDPVGHGTGESANIFAVAPAAELQAIRASNNSGDLVGAITGFLRAKDLNPRIITSSWGGDSQFPATGPLDPGELAFAAEIQDAIAQNILVIFSAGNGQFSMEPQVPGVLAAGGVFVSDNGDLRASDYASGYRSPFFQGVNVPTVSALVGMRPRAQYLMLPIPPACLIDVDESQPDLPADPTTDGTTGNDGWALFSGTSAAAPQLAGAAAVLIGAKPNMVPAQVIRALTATAVDVVAGRCHPRFNNTAQIGPDLATGAGLVNVAAALKFAQDNF
jgi:subtilisin family serine protease